MKQLIEKLREASKPDRALDWEIHCRNGVDGVGAYGPHPAYTGSMDAAITLVPTAQNWSIETEPMGHYAKTWTMEPPKTYAGQCFNVRDNEAASAAIALCIAALRCRLGT